uniref:Uncharacterized protein n=1 Tax=Escherichia coli TaxID=562 RepID=A0A2S0NSV5_ECOLX|nr:hypothetical protein [Escherichia coli]
MSPDTLHTGFVILKSGLTFFRISDKKERNRDMHKHMPGIYICYRYTYATHLPILNICTHPVL